MPRYTLWPISTLCAVALLALQAQGCGPAPDQAPQALRQTQQRGLPNRPPVAAPFERQLEVDQPLLLDLQATDPDGDPLTFTFDPLPQHGSLTLDDLSGFYVYTPDPGFEGVDEFAFTASDGDLSSEPAPVRLTVGEVNRAPAALPQALTLEPGTSTPITLLADDLEGDPLQFEVVQAPMHGALSGAAPNLTYTPAPGFSGTDRLTFVASDGQQTSAEAEVLLQVGDNLPPVALSQQLRLPVDQPLAFTLSGEDPNGDNLSFEVVEAPASGTLSGTAPNLTYTPDLGFVGTARMRFVAHDQHQASAPGEIEFVVGDLDAPPTAEFQDLRAGLNQPVEVTLRGQDPEGQPLTFLVVRPPNHGTLSGTAPNLTYTPEEDFTGIDSLAYVVSDGAQTSEAAQVTILVGGINRPPVALNQTLQLQEEGSLSFSLTGEDPDGDPLTFEILALPQHGALEGEPPALTYRPQRDFFGVDQVEFRVRDGQDVSGVGVIGLQVLPRNDAPLASPLNLTTGEDQPIAFTLRGEDPDGDPLTFEILEVPSQGMLSGTPPNLTYTPAPGFSGTDRFVFQATDGQEGSGPTQVQIQVLNTNNQPPEASGGQASTPEDTPLAIQLEASDPDGDALTWLILEAPAHGALSGSPPNLTYTPEADFAGPDSLRFQVSDGRALSQEATFSVTVEPRNDPPEAQPQGLALRAGASLPLVLTATDVDSSPLSFQVVRPPAHGALSGTAPNLTYTPEPGFSGPDSFAFTASDGQATSPEATVSLQVLPQDQPNRPPVTQGQTLEGVEDTALPVLLGASDPDGDSLSYTITAFPMHGTLLGSPPNLIYNPFPSYAGPDSFTFTASDGQATSPEATVTLSIAAQDDPPEALPLAFFTVANEPVAVTLVADDPEGAPLSYELLSQPSHGSLSGQPPNLTYTPEPGFRGMDSFTWRASAQGVPSQPATAVLTVGGFNTPPAVMDQDLQAQQDTPLAITLVANDPDGDPLTFLISAPPSQGLLTGDAPHLTYTPREGFSGQDSFDFLVSDGEVFVSGQVRLTVAALVRQDPVLTWQTEPGWLQGPQRLSAVVQDDRCERLPRLASSQGSPGLALSAAGPSRWELRSAPLADGVYAVRLHVSSACSAQSVTAERVFGVDNQAPGISALPFAEASVDPEDPSTWPALDPLRAPLQVLLHDATSGLASFQVQLQSGQQAPLSLAQESFAPQPGLLPQGPARQAPQWCQAPAYCQGGRLRPEALEALGPDLVLTFTTTDLSGQQAQRATYLGQPSLLLALQRWRAWLEQQGQEGPTYQAALARLEQAQQWTREEDFGALLLSLSQLGQEHRLLDLGLPGAGRQTFWWLHTALARSLENTNPSSEAYTQGQESLREASEHLRGGSAVDTARALAQAWFWLSLSQEPALPQEPLAQAVQLHTQVLTQLQGEERAQPLLPSLAALTPLLEQAAEQGLSSLLPREQLQVLEVLSHTLEQLKALEAESIWVRNWQWALARVMAPFGQALRQGSLSLLGEEHALAPLAQAQGEALVQARAPWTLDTYLTLLQEDRCLQGALHDLARDPDRATWPASCCPDLAAYRALEPTTPRPPICQ